MNKVWRLDIQYCACSTILCIENFFFFFSLFSCYKESRSHVECYHNKNKTKAKHKKEKETTFGSNGYVTTLVVVAFASVYVHQVN